MASGSIQPKKAKNGEIHYQITIEGDRDPETGKRNRSYKTVKGTKKEAKAEMRRLISEVEHGKSLKQSSMTVKEWIAKWMELYITPYIEETTRVGYKTKLKCYIHPMLGDIKIKSLRAEHIQRMVNDMLAKGLSPKNIRDTYNIVNASMKKAVALKEILYNPCEGVELPKQKKYRAKVYDTKTIHEILDIAKGSDIYLAILILTTVGLRRGELLALRWENIDFDKQIIKVRENMVRGEDGFILKAPKTEAGIRDIHIGKDLVEILKEAHTQYKVDRMRYGLGFQDLGFVIRQEDGSPLHPDSMTRKWIRFIKANDLPQIRLHDLRHSNATALIRAGVSPKVVSERLGHADVSITLSTYTHVLPDMDAAAADKLDEILLKNA